MAVELITVPQPLAANDFGLGQVNAEHDFRADGDTCLFEYVGSTLNRDSITILGTGSNYLLTVTPLQTTQEECESPPEPPNTCRKVISLNVRLRRSFSILGFTGEKSIILNVTKNYVTNCLEQCCS